MSLGLYTLEIDGVSRTLDEWGISEATVIDAALRGGSLSFVIPGATSDAPVAEYLDLVRLYAPSGQCVFIGPMMEPKPNISATREGWSYTVADPSFWLEHAPYRQPWSFPDLGESSYATNETEMAQTDVSLVILFRDSASGAKVDLYTQLGDALEQGKTYLAGKGVSLNYDRTYIPHQANIWDDGVDVEPPEDSKRDVSVLDVIETCLRWVQYITPRWDYSTGTPTLRFSSAAAMDAGGTLLGLPRLRGADLVTHTVTASDCKVANLSPMNKRVVPKLTIRYLITNTATVSEQEYVWGSTETDVSEVANGGFGEVEITVPLRGLVWNGSTLGEPEPRPPDGMATAMHQAFARMWWKFSLTFVAEDCDWGKKVGELWNVTGTGTGPANAGAVAQRIVRDLSSGTTMLECGAPSHMGYDDLTALLLPNRLRTIPGKAGDQQYGFGKDDKEKEEEREDAEDVELLAVTRGGIPGLQLVKIGGAFAPL